MINDNLPADSYLERLGRNIRAARLLQGMTLEEVADRLGVSYQQLQKYEAGQAVVSVPRLREIASALDTTSAQLIPQDAAAPQGAMTPRVLQTVAAVESLPSDRIRGDIVQLIHGINLAWRGRS